MMDEGSKVIIETELKSPVCWWGCACLCPITAKCAERGYCCGSFLLLMQEQQQNASRSGNLADSMRLPVEGK